CSPRPNRQRSGPHRSPHPFPTRRSSDLRVAEVSAPINREPVELAPEPVYAGVTWVSSYDVDPFEVPISEKTALLADWSAGMLGRDRKSTRLNSSHVKISYAVFCLKKKRV